MWKGSNAKTRKIQENLNRIGIDWTRLSKHHSPAVPSLGERRFAWRFRKRSCTNLRTRNWRNLDGWLLFWGIAIQPKNYKILSVYVNICQYHTDSYNNADSIIQINAVNTTFSTCLNDLSLVCRQLPGQTICIPGSNEKKGYEEVAPTKPDETW